MTDMLASVTSVYEADLAMRGGADIIDIKNPGQGALGAQDVSVIQAIVKHVAAERLVSATVGDILPDDPLLPEKINAVAATGVDIVKVGLFARRPTSAFLARIQSAVQNNINIVLVVFAENEPLQNGLDELLQSGVYGVMVDTCNKDGRSLRDHMDYNRLQLFIKTVQSNGRLVGLAGSLALNDVAALLVLGPDYLGFRGALCAGAQRTAGIDAARVQSVRQAVHNIANIGYGGKQLWNTI